MNAASSTTKGIANAVGIVTLASGSNFFPLALSGEVSHARQSESTLSIALA
jgi:hypothetical protein